MSHPSTRRYRVYLLGAILLIGFVVGVAYWLLGQQGAHERAEAASHADRIARYASEFVEHVFTYADAYLLVARERHLSAGGTNAVEELLDTAPLNRGLVSHITILDAIGTPIFISGHEIKPGTTAKDRPYFKAMLEASGDPVHVSGSRRGRNTGRLTIRLVRRMATADGAFRGAVFAALDLQRINVFFESLDLGVESDLAIVGDDGLIRASSNVERLPLNAPYRAAMETVSAHAGGQDEVFVSRQAVKGFPLEIVAAVGMADVSDRGYYRTVYSATVSATIILALLAFLIIREVRAKENAVTVNRKLESRVAERTAELSRLNENLSRELAEGRETRRALVNLQSRLSDYLKASADWFWETDGTYDFRIFPNSSSPSQAFRHDCFSARPARKRKSRGSTRSNGKPFSRRFASTDPSTTSSIPGTIRTRAGSGFRSTACRPSTAKESFSVSAAPAAISRRSFMLRWRSPKP